MVHHQVSISFLALLVLSASADLSRRPLYSGGSSSSLSESTGRKVGSTGTKANTNVQGVGAADAKATAKNDQNKSDVDGVDSRFGLLGGHGHGHRLRNYGSVYSPHANLAGGIGQQCCPCGPQGGAANSAANSQAVANVKPEINIFTNNRKEDDSSPYIKDGSRNV